MEKISRKTVEKSWNMGKCWEIFTISPLQNPIESYRITSSHPPFKKKQPPSLMDSFLVPSLCKSHYKSPYNRKTCLDFFWWFRPPQSAKRQQVYRSSLLTLVNFRHIKHDPMHSPDQVNSEQSLLKLIKN